MTIFSLVFLDQYIKFLIVENHPAQTVIDGIFGIFFVPNTGTVFGIAQNNNAVFTLLSFFIIVLLTVVFLLTTQKYSKIRFAWKMIIAGGIGNIIDRIFRGYVVDYIFLKPFGVFNLADLMIVFGAIFLIFHVLVYIGIDEEG